MIPKDMEFWLNLTKKQQVMIKHYSKHGNKTAAYTHAFYPDGDHEDRVKKSTLYTNAAKEFRKPKVAMAVEKIQREALIKAMMSEKDVENSVNKLTQDLMSHQEDLLSMQIDACWVLKRAALLADFNINKFIKVIGGEAYYDFSSATDEDWYCLQEYSVDRTTVKSDDGYVPVTKVRLKSVDKIRALELVGKHIDVSAFKDKLELSGDEESPIITITRKIVGAGPTDES